MSGRPNGSRTRPGLVLTYWLEDSFLLPRSKELNIELVKIEKRVVSKALWRGKNHRRLYGRSRNELNHWKLPQWINLLVGRVIPYQEITLYKGLTNWCCCKIIDFNWKYLIWHVKEHHQENVIICIYLSLNPIIYNDNLSNWDNLFLTNIN